MSSLLQDVRYAFRQLRKSPAFTLTVVLTLALGIGANAAVFTLFDQVLLRMLPVERPKELVRLQWTGSFSGSGSSFGGDLANYFSYPMYRDLRDRNHVFAGVMAADRAEVGLSWHNQAEEQPAEIVSGNYFQLLGLKPALGRLIMPQDDTAKNANPVVVLSYSYWKARFASSPEVAGRTVLINGHPFTILGVGPANFDSAIGGYRPGVFVPISMSEVAMPSTVQRDNLNNHQSVWLTLVARLKPGVSRQEAEASLAPLWRNLRAYELTLYKNHSQRFGQRFVDLSKLTLLDDSTGFMPERGDLKTPLVILMSMAGLLVAMCAINVATLLLLRAAGRAREMSMRYALGAKRWQIVVQLLVEGGLLGAAGSIAGLALAPAVAGVLVRLMTSCDPGKEPFSAAVDTRVLLFTLGISVVVTLLFSVAPAVHFLFPDLGQALRQNAGTAAKGSQRFRKFAVGAQIALSVLLLGSAGLFVRSLDNLRNEPVGFETQNMTTFALNPTISGYGDDRTQQIVKNVLDRVRAIPGVTMAAATDDPELEGNTETSNFSVQGHIPSEDEKLEFELPWVTSGYFATLHEPLLAGREFTDADAKGAPKVAVLNLTAAKRYFGTRQNAIGHTLARGGANEKLDTTIVGVVGDVKHFDLRTDPVATVYEPYLQLDHPGGVQIYVRSTQPPETIEPAIRQAVHQLDSTLVVDALRTMQAEVDNSASDNRALAFLAIGFSVLAMILAAVGLYGVLAYSTEQRTREIGVRLALGSRRWAVVTLVVREMALIAAVATAVALPSVVAVARLFRSQLYGVSTFDPVALTGAFFLTAVMVLLAAVLPARRASRIEPMQALRTE
jgi:putative ABC transport system permease protein